MQKAALIVFISLICFGALAKAQETEEVENEAPQYELIEGRLFFLAGEEKKEIELPAPGLSIRLFKDKLYVALGDQGALVFKVSPTGDLVDALLVPISHGQVTGFLEIEGELWMHVNSSTAVKLSGVAGLPMAGVAPLVTPTPGALTRPQLPAQETPAPTRDSKPEDAPIRITALYAGKVKLDAGLDAGLKVGDLLPVYRSERVSQIGGESFEGRVQVATLEVEAIGDSSSIALIWRGDRVSKSDVVGRAPKKAKPSKIYPRHLTNLGEVEVALRPIINIGNDEGFGALCDVVIAWWGKHYFVDLRMQPLGFGWVNDGKVVTNSLLAEVGYNGRAFAVGMGLGMASVNGDMDEMLNYSVGYPSADEYGNPEEPPPWEQRTQHGFALSQTVRLGAKDGLHLAVNNLLVYHKNNPDYDYEEKRSGFIYGGTSGRLSIPIALRISWFWEGGGGVMGYGFGATGVSTWVRGNGDAGSIGVLASAGFAGLWGVRRRENAGGWDDIETMNIVGPMFSIGAVYRFGKMPK